ncbi:hypothetical protein CDD83_10472 [Cordyceps sp. RAO-2017]|nr:hypothetical protein CDD83_10472 [Cordyceps sp. RAO-2017]
MYSSAQPPPPPSPCPPPAPRLSKSCDSGPRQASLATQATDRAPIAADQSLPGGGTPTPRQGGHSSGKGETGEWHRKRPAHVRLSDITIHSPPPPACHLVGYALDVASVCASPVRSRPRHADGSLAARPTGPRRSPRRGFPSAASRVEGRTGRRLPPVDRCLVPDPVAYAATRPGLLVVVAVLALICPAGQSERDLVP